MGQYCHKIDNYYNLLHLLVVYFAKLNLILNLLVFCYLQVLNLTSVLVHLLVK